MDKPITSADIGLLIVAAKIASDHGEHVLTVQPARHGQRAAVHLTGFGFRLAMDLTGADVTIGSRDSTAYPWEPEFTIDGVRFHCILRTVDLPQIGYDLPGYQPAAAMPIRIVGEAPPVAVE